MYAFHLRRRGSNGTDRNHEHEEWLESRERDACRSADYDILINDLLESKHSDHRTPPVDLGGLDLSEENLKRVWSRGPVVTYKTAARNHYVDNYTRAKSLQDFTFNYIVVFSAQTTACCC